MFLMLYYKIFIWLSTSCKCLCKINYLKKTSKVLAKVGIHLGVTSISKKNQTHSKLPNFSLRIFQKYDFLAWKVMEIKKKKS